MTEHKSRKHLVRERMARTGESYSTAHRHVSAHRPTLSAPATVTRYPAIRSGQHQPSTLAQNLLAQAGLPLSEAMACGLGGGIGFLYAIFDYHSVPHPLLTIVMQHHPQPWLEAVTDHLGVATATATSSSANAALGKLDAALDAGRPAWIVVGRGLLPWHGDVSDLEAADPFPVVVAGRVGDEFVIDDGDQPRLIGREGLGAAWSAHRKARFALTTVAEMPGNLDLGRAITGALTTTVDHLTGPVLGNYFDANMGHRGLAKFRTDLRDRTTKAGWSRRFSEPVTFTIAMQRLAECVTWQHTGAGGTRPLFGDFLAEAAATAPLDLLPAAHSARRAGEIWIQIADLAGNRDRYPDRRQLLDELADLVDTALSIETTMVQQIRESLGQPREEGSDQMDLGISASPSISSSSS
jgi:hypothetical protein